MARQLLELARQLLELARQLLELTRQILELAWQILELARQGAYTTLKWSLLHFLSVPVTAWPIQEFQPIHELARQLLEIPVTVAFR